VSSTTPEPLDVLVVGEHRREVARSLAEEGLRAEARPGIFPALALLRLRGAKVVVLGHEQIEGHSANPIDEIRASGGAARVLLLLPENRRDDEEWVGSVGADDGLVEPCYTELLLRHVRDLMADVGEQTWHRPPAPVTHPTPEELLRQIHRAARDLPVLRTVLVQGLGRLTMARRASLMLHRPSSRDLFLAEGSGLPEEVQRGLRVKVGAGVVGRVAERARPVAIADIDSTEFRDVASPARYATGSFLSVPLVADARVLGVLSFADRVDGTPFSRAHLDAILPIVDTAAAVIRNALLIRRLRAASMLDRLTGLYNRRYFERARKKELKRARRYEHPLSLLLVDADRFKHINDAEGHPTGDEALRALAATLREVFRATDILCRYGGDEFAVLMPETDGERARQAVERLHAALRQTHIPGEEHVPGGKLGVSCGIATFPHDAPEPGELVEIADRELYDEKKRRRNAAS
jgi:diguanylate cyclase (GGDEF)-like protein